MATPQASCSNSGTYRPAVRSADAAPVARGSQECLLSSRCTPTPRIGTTCSSCEVSDAPVYRSTRPIGASPACRAPERASRSPDGRRPVRDALVSGIGRPGHGSDRTQRRGRFSRRTSVARDGDGTPAQTSERRDAARRAYAAYRLAGAERAVDQPERPSGQAVRSPVASPRPCRGWRVSTDCGTGRARRCSPTSPGIGPFFAVGTGAAPGEGWVPVRRAARTRDGRSRTGRPSRRAVAGRGAGHRAARVAASIAFQGIAAQVVAPLFAAVAVHGALPDRRRVGVAGVGRRRDAALAPRAARGAVAVVAASARAGSSRAPTRRARRAAHRSCSPRWSPPSGRSVRGRRAGAVGQRGVVRGERPAAGRRGPPGRRPARRRRRPAPARRRRRSRPRRRCATPAAARRRLDLPAPLVLPLLPGSRAAGSAATACCAGRSAANAAPPAGVAHRPPPRLATRTGRRWRSTSRAGDRPGRWPSPQRVRGRDPTLHQFRGVTPVKSTVERLSPTRVRINVEVPFDELKPDFDRAYKKIAQQVRMPGFRRARCPPASSRPASAAAWCSSRSSTTRSPRSTPRPSPRPRTCQPARAAGDRGHRDRRRRAPRVHRRGRRPPGDHAAGLSSASRSRSTTSEVTDADVDEELDNLRARFATLTGVERPAAKDDFVQIDLSATVDGEAVEEAQTSGFSYQVGQGGLIDGIDEAITRPVRGRVGHVPHHARGRGVRRTARTPRSPSPSPRSRSGELPDADDEFAQLASEFDTLDELTADLRTRLGRVQQMEQLTAGPRQGARRARRRHRGAAARGHRQVGDRRRACTTRSTRSTTTRTKFAEFLEENGKTREEFDTECARGRREVGARAARARRAGRRQEGHGQARELTERIVFQAQQYQMPPEEFVRRIQEAGQLGAIYSDVRRSKALIAAVRAATVTDASGAPWTWRSCSAATTSGGRGRATSRSTTTADDTEGASEADPDAVETAEEPVDSPATDARRRTSRARPRWTRLRTTRSSRPCSPRAAGRQRLRVRHPGREPVGAAHSEQRLRVRSVTAPSA